MKRFLTVACAFLCLSAFGQTQESGILDRFTDPAKGRTVFISKGHRAAGISGTYRYLNVGGEQDGDGYQILSMFNIGNGSLHYYSVAPSYSWFAADDISLGVRLEYTGYTLDSDLKLDLRQATGTDDPELNLRLMCRHMHSNSFVAAVTGRRYVSFFGSKMIAVFGEGRLFGRYGRWLPGLWMKRMWRKRAFVAIPPPGVPVSRWPEASAYACVTTAPLRSVSPLSVSVTPIPVRISSKGLEWRITRLPCLLSG